MYIWFCHNKKLVLGFYHTDSGVMINICRYYLEELNLRILYYIFWMISGSNYFVLNYEEGYPASPLTIDIRKPNH